MRGFAAVAVVAACQYKPPLVPLDDAPADMPVDTPIDAPIDMPLQPFWLNVIGALPGDGTLMDTAATGWKRSGASTRDQIPSGNGYVEFGTAENTLGKAFGLSNGDVDANYTDIDFAIHLKGNRDVAVFENAIQIGIFGTYVATDVFKVEVMNNVVVYKKNDVVFLTSLRTPTFPLLGDAALFHTNSTLINVSVVRL
jgi:hypothetical protein